MHDLVHPQPWVRTIKSHVWNCWTDGNGLQRQGCGGTHSKRDNGGTLYDSSSHRQLAHDFLVVVVTSRPQESRSPMHHLTFSNHGNDFFIDGVLDERDATDERLT